MLSAWIFPHLKKFSNLLFYPNTAITASTRDSASGRITSVTGVSRTVKSGQQPWGRLQSAALSDWYSPDDSAVFSKQVDN
jgi:hypothetical protein